MKKTFATLGLQNQEFEELKRCIRKVPILVQCVNTEKDRVKRVNSTRPASTRIFPLLSGQDEGSCSQENLNREIRRLKQEGDIPTLELITCYRNLRDNPELNVQIEDSLHKEVYKKICSVLNRLVEEDEAAELNSLIEHGGSNYSDYNRAVLLYEEILARKRRVLGEDDPDTLTTLKKLADFISQMGYTKDRALPLYEELLTKQKQVLGEDDPDTLTTLKKLAQLFWYKGEYDRAGPLLEELLTKQKLLLGDDHPDTLNSLKKLAVLFKFNREYDRAEPIFQELLTKERRTLGDDHPDTNESLILLANTLKDKGEFDRALPLFQEWAVRRDDNFYTPAGITAAANAKEIRKQQEKEVAQAPFPRAQAQAQAPFPQAPFPIEIQSTTLPTLPNSTLPNSTGGKSKNKRNHKNKSFRSTRRRRYSRARGGKKIAASSSKTIKRRRKNAR